MQRRRGNKYQIDSRKMDDETVRFALKITKCLPTWSSTSMQIISNCLNGPFGTTLNVPSTRKLRTTGKQLSIDERTKIEYPKVLRQTVFQCIVPTTLATFSFSKYDSTLTICIGFDGMPNEWSRLRCRRRFSNCIGSARSPCFKHSASYISRGLFSFIFAALFSVSSILNLL